MKDICYSTENEKKLILAAQQLLNIDANGIIGMNTLSTLFFRAGVKLDAPVTLQLYGCPAIIGKDILAWSPKQSIKSYSNSISGSFTYPRATTPCSILVNAGKVVNGSACHAHLDKPESVIYKCKDGEIGVKRVLAAAELPDDTVVAVGGMGLLQQYNPTAEGFTGTYADVLRKINHVVLGVKNGYFYGVYFKNLNAVTINNLCEQKFRFDYAIMLDGGGLAAINGTESFAKININTKQGYALQFI